MSDNKSVCISSAIKEKENRGVGRGEEKGRKEELSRVSASDRVLRAIRPCVAITSRDLRACVIVGSEPTSLP